MRLLKDVFTLETFMTYNRKVLSVSVLLYVIIFLLLFAITPVQILVVAANGAANII